MSSALCVGGLAWVAKGTQCPRRGNSQKWEFSTKQCFALGRRRRASAAGEHILS